MTSPLMGMIRLPGLYDPWHWALAVDRVRLVGDPVAIVVADTRRWPRTRASWSTSSTRSCTRSRPWRTPTTRPGRRSGRRPTATSCTGSESYGDVDAAFAEADRVISETFHQHRHANQPMETRGTVAEIDADGKLIVHSATQAAHGLSGRGNVLGSQPMWQSLRMLPPTANRRSRCRGPRLPQGQPDDGRHGKR